MTQIETINTLFFQYLPSRDWHHGFFFGGILAFEVIGHLLKCNPLDTFMLVDVVDNSTRQF